GGIAMDRRQFIRGTAALAAAIAAGTGFAFQSAQAATGLNAQAAQELLYMREEEKLARDVYRQAYGRWGRPVFARVAQAEQRHMDIMGRMLAYYGLSDPIADPNASGGFTDTRLAKLYAELTTRASKSAGDALQAAGLIEEVDIMDLEKAASSAPDALLRRAYANIERGSRNHLRGFTSEWTRLTAKPYTAQAMPQSAVDAIVASPIERGRRRS
ncbi:MAG: DUF2202 domain-containing protein, partial [Acidihalobacter sp.]